MKLTGIEQALRDGCTLHAFRSGGGLRIISINKPHPISNGSVIERKGYGEHPSVEDALSHAQEDYLAGGRKYEDVYGNTKPHYLTGESHATSRLDALLLGGGTMDMEAINEATFKCVLEYYESQSESKEDYGCRVRRIGYGTDFWNTLKNAWKA